MHRCKGLAVLRLTLRAAIQQEFWVRVRSGLGTDFPRAAQQACGQGQPFWQQGPWAEMGPAIPRSNWKNKYKSQATSLPECGGWPPSPRGARESVGCLQPSGMEPGSGRGPPASPLTVRGPAQAKVLPKMMESTGLLVSVPVAVRALQVAGTKMDLEVQGIYWGEMAVEDKVGGAGRGGGPRCKFHP